MSKGMITILEVSQAGNMMEPLLRWVMNKYQIRKFAANFELLAIIGWEEWTEGYYWRC